MSDNEKMCSRCKRVKDVNMFSKLKNGHQSYCKLCAAKVAPKYKKPASINRLIKYMVKL